MSDMVNQWWTLLGMFIAWVVLEGSAKTVVGYAIMASLVVWGLTYRLRNPKDKDESI
jgi:hypothetical protein